MKWRHRWKLALLGSLPLFGVLSAAAAETVEFGGGTYHVFRVVEADQPKLHLVWTDEQQKPLGSLAGLNQWVSGKGRELVFAMNAGIYERGPKPCGLTVCEGKILVPLNLQPGEGNFFLKPNGVFYLDDQHGAGVMEAEEYSKSGLQPRLATQSGPLLLRKGRMHPAFREGSPNKRLRNAVGVRKSDGMIVFVMSEREDRLKGRVTFHQLSQFFLHLGCEDALYLDGDISEMVVNPTKDTKFLSNTFAGMFYVVK